MTSHQKTTQDYVTAGTQLQKGLDNGAVPAKQRFSFPILL
jgi:hypothetical protein